MPTVKTTVTQTGGKKLAKILREAGKGGVSAIDVGFFSTARYQNGTPVAAVAAWNEFGTNRIPERPFFRRAIRKIDMRIKKLLRGVDPLKMVIDKRQADVIGAYASDIVQESITELATPPNKPSTIEAKRRKLHGRKRTERVGPYGQDAVEESNPLIDTGFMRESVTWKVH